jgi:ATP-binding cassette subfamily C (CFTR/MRP) protein 1
MKSIKLYAWNTAFMTKLEHIRGLELHTLRKIGSTQALANFAWSSAPFLVSCCTFGIFALTSNRPLTTDIVFPALTLFNLLGFPLALFPLVLTSAVEASVAVKRLTEYLTAEELQPDAVTFEESALNEGNESVKVSDASFSWNRYHETPVWENIHFSARKGELTCILGRVGSGKSSLLQSLLGDLWKSSGDVTLRGQVAYVAQSPWVMNTSIRDNIIFGHRWDPHFYDITLEACALQDDMKELPDGDQTEVGERGISLSGGQKSRLALARAVYARADIYILDDILSAVDQHVGRHIINRVLGKHGILKSKTRILATNTVTILDKADFIVLIQNKTLTETGTYDQLLAMKGEVANLIHTTTNGSDDEHDSDQEFEGIAGPATSDSTPIMESADSGVTIESGTSARRTSTGTLRRASTASWSARRKQGDEENGGLKTKQTTETSQQGKVRWSVYREYAKESNVVALCFYFFCIMASQTAQVAGSFWLKIWSEDDSSNVGKFIGIYFALGIGSSLLVIFQNLILWIFCSIEV